MKGFINLGKRSESVGIAVPEETKNRVNYPSLYLNDVDLGDVVDGKDLGKEMEATVKIKLTKMTTSEEKDGGVRHSCDFDLLAIKFHGQKDS